MILTKYNRELAHQMVDSAPDGHVIEVKPAKRSLEQNRLYWAILSDISLDEFSEYVDKVIKWAVEHEVKLSEEAR